MVEIKVPPARIERTTPGLGIRQPDGTDEKTAGACGAISRHGECSDAEIRTEPHGRAAQLWAKCGLGAVTPAAPPVPSGISSSFLGGTAFFCEPGSAPGCDLGVLFGLGALLLVAAAVAIADALVQRRRRRRQERVLADANDHLRELDRLLGTASGCSARDERPRGGASPLPAPRASSREAGR